MNGVVSGVCRVVYIVGCWFVCFGVGVVLYVVVRCLPCVACCSLFDVCCVVCVV